MKILKGNTSSAFVGKYLTPFLFFLFPFSCNTTDPPDTKLSLSLEDVSCTEAWIKVEGQTGSEIILKRDNVEEARITLSSSSQTIMDDALLPNKAYNYQAIRNGDASNKITVNTMDTTSGNFTFQTWTFGDIGSSALYDCAIISENNIWCVGEIKIADSSEDIYTPYSAIHWDGSEWELKKLYYKDKDYQGNDFTMVLSNIWSVYAFNNTDIWLTAGSVFSLERS